MRSVLLAVIVLMAGCAPTPVIYRDSGDSVLVRGSNGWVYEQFTIGGYTCISHTAGGLWCEQTPRKTK